MDWHSRDGIEWLEAALPGARAAFTTRAGGVSEPPFASLNLGVLTEDQRESVLENRRRLVAALGLDPARVVIGRQVHGTDLATHGGPQAGGYFPGPHDSIPEVDGHVVTEPGLAALVLTADCLPIALAGPHRLAMVHCGWRGLAAGIIARAVEATAASHAAIGPGIGACCYEVGADLIAAFAPLGDGIAMGRMLDMTEIARRLLRRRGVEQIDAADICTRCQADRFFSHRRDGRTGRQAGVAWMEPAATVAG